MTDRLSGYGTDIGGGNTAELLDYLQQRFGPVSSFSGSYRADRWELTIHRNTESPISHRVSCPPLRSPLNGRLSVNDNKTSYTCNIGFYATGGDRTRNCLATGEWSGQPPICVRVQCQILRSPLGGQVFVNSYAYLATARYSCDAGRILVGPETRTCEADGFWSGYAPSCEVGML